jgi:hypothetical protein
MSSNFRICHDLAGQSVKHRGGRLLTDGGIVIDCNLEQPENAPHSIRFNLDPDSKVNDESMDKSLKQYSPRISTEAGMQTARNLEHRNAPLSIRVNLDPDSNVNDESD